MSSADAPGDDDSVAPLSAEPSRKPLDTALRQQRMKSWQPILDPTWVIVTLLIIGVAFLAGGLVMQKMSDALIELSRTYDAYDMTNPPCGIDKANANKSCTLEFEVTGDMEPPILVHYEIQNFYQNHRRMYKSRDDEQLKGSDSAQTTVAARNCEPLNKLGNQTINPCGLIANTLFNDVFTLTAGKDAEGNALIMKETGIAWETDLQYKFKQPSGFKSELCSSCDQNCECTSPEWSCQQPYVDKNGQCHRYYYPNDDTTRYLYETYPMVVNPIDGVTNEHFVVWMRTAALPKFRKLYGWINQPIQKGEIIKFDLIANWEVGSFQGAKSLILSTNNQFGGKNPYLGRYYWIVGVVCLILGFLFGVKHTFRPRKLGDKRYLKYKEE
mmetsp:Transcript_9448/g.13880  ORF Transcript_9448/g.13880 Transcript_9448/m.13880 type:complete len:384 (+) Transcript_9448:40-1191(+)|eukprot:CAMPEP_0195530414 /NCGR_PEP_ID=MMETSP0794_2-20130614/33285_1 /TAXON_ID=515487 /ORGANISM="Stephanopyxis turris, Strain CCMP 815" /LENGTH=383 /DNA_ID=CAMNT_0040661921 /DNA_START=40 /DNA_END=1191 /DNA_ORIENTATION=+